MTDHAVFFNRGMFPDKRPAFFRMTFVAELIDIFRREHMVGEGSVRVVAIRTFYFAFNDRMVRLFV